MKLATFNNADGIPRVGIVVNGGIIDLFKHLHFSPCNMIGLIQKWSEYRELLESLEENQGADVDIDSAQLLAPIPRPGKILAVGLNYADHVAEAGLAKPENLLWFSKMVTAVNPPYAGVHFPCVSGELDYEAELAFIIGKRCKHVSVEQAPRVIFGYCAANDVSVRDWQLRTSEFMIGKSFDTHAPFGPWIVTSDELGDPHKLGIRSFVNGEKRQESNTRELIFNCFDQVAHLSKVMTLEPGDVILTGTPGGVGIGHKPPQYLVPGDVVRVEIDGIGAIENRVVPETAVSS